ncbi:C4b-binding protein alpha chain-like isoform X1 [Tachysurus fulvidraco]|uniref:C4b-binding protein alpha chain-like isoform X1 n=1 Tax=Tachysurus fulvidraco TaxID=1234273 RepID=UPI001FEF8F39|nr:C4b-binding protein alpha chain-like isoform X1 [Tachysurus fulvidraco]XP_047662903.1 C4b-binding protein alpha chain-like isoform X1 [Tachysurus fulvidraco]XP_047662904.1 C4b-binding protein alpha chain-like isoform X1 [Tachysurus fulvidraco]XP_047662905.1 C4b-binding protein alpha chain-like isoform X1 [Tachysurus fulvidraco]
MWETPSYTLIVLLICLMKAGEIRAQCASPVIGENRILTEPSRQDNFPDGSTLTYKCSTGYVPKQPGSSKTITCKGNQWTELQLQCKLKSCGSPGEISNGKYLTPNGIDFGATITAQCNEGYMLVGERTRNCRDNGWDGRDAVCEVTKCKQPPSIQNGNFDPLDEVYNYGQTVTYSCEKDYILFGESTISCSDNGSFPPPPRCLKVSCDAPAIENAVRIQGRSPPYKYKEFVEYQCNKGYKMEGSGYLICEENEWKPPPPVCIEDKIGPGPGPGPNPGPGPSPSEIPKVTVPPPLEELSVGAKIAIGVGVMVIGILLVSGMFYLKKRTGFGKVPTRNEERS